MKYSEVKNKKSLLITTHDFTEEIKVSNCLFVSDNNLSEKLMLDNEIEDEDIYYQAIFNGVFGLVHFQNSDPIFKSLEEFEFNGHIEDEDEFELTYIYEQGWENVTYKYNKIELN